MKNFDEVIIFNKKTFSDLLKEIYNNSVSRNKEIKDLIAELPPMDDMAAANVYGPIITGLVREDIKNDENLLKLAGIVSRLMNSNNGEDDGNITEAEKEQLLAEANKLISDIKQ